MAVAAAATVSASVVSVVPRRADTAIANSAPSAYSYEVRVTADHDASSTLRTGTLAAAYGARFVPNSTMSCSIFEV